MPELNHHVVRVRGISAHAVEAGEGPPLVLQHGFPQDWHSWQAVIPMLAEHFRVICPDMRGFGASDAPEWGYDKEGLAQDLLGLTEALGIERFSLAGHDWGGFVSFIAALRSPDRIQRLVLLNTALGFTRVDLRLLLALRGFWYMPLLGTPIVGEAVMRSRSFPRRVLNRAGQRDSSEAPVATCIAQIRDDPARAHAARRLYGTFVFGESASLLSGRYRHERLTVPTLFIHGDADRAVRSGLLRGYESRADDLQIELVPGAGHFVCDAEPELVAERMISFLEADATANGGGLRGR